MEEQDWKDIIDELTEQIKRLSIELAVSKSDVKKAVKVIQERDKRIEKLAEPNAEIPYDREPSYNITTKE